MARADSISSNAESADHVRLRQFGSEHAGPVPVAALGRIAEGAATDDLNHYVLRADPVSLRADMTRVFLLGHGFDGIDDAARDMVDACVRETLAHEGFEAIFTDGHWTLELAQTPGFDFLPLERALGMNVAEALPSSLQARPWRRLMNEVQIALHHHEVRAYCRAHGMPEINSIWFWGGGSCPQQVPRGRFDAVVSQSPVSRGLAVLAGASERGGEDYSLPSGQALFHDWAPASRDAGVEMRRLDNQIGQWLTDVREGRLELCMLDASGREWRVGRRQMRRFWRRPGLISDALAGTESAS